MRRFMTSAVRPRSWQSSTTLTGVIVFILLMAESAYPSESGRPILDRWAALEKGERWWNTRYQRLRVVVVNPRGEQGSLELEGYDTRERDLRQKSLVQFISPADKAGIALLSHTRPGSLADQWLCTPGTHRVRQISGDDRFNRFSITDFTPHDLDLLADIPFWSDDDARSTLGERESIDGVECHRIELIPQRDIKYSRVVLWLGSDDLIPRKIEFYDRPPEQGILMRLISRFFGLGERPRAGEQPVRRFRQGDFQWIDTVPIARRIEAETPDDSSVTKIEVIAVQLGQHFNDSMFSAPGMIQKCR